MNCSTAQGVCYEERETSDSPFLILDLRLIQNRQSEIQNDMAHRLPLRSGPPALLQSTTFFELEPHFSPGREVRERRFLKTQGFDESSAERPERDKARRHTVQYVEPFVRAGLCRFGPAPHSLSEVG